MSRRTRRPKPTTDQRTPEQRLESLVRESNPDRSSRMLARILDDLDASPEPGPWIAAARTLSERLIISEDSFYFFTELFTECLTLAASTTDPELCRISREMQEIERANGLREDETWLVGDAPDDWRQLGDAWERREGEIIASRLRELGHADLATARSQHNADFLRRVEQGRVDLWGEDDHDDHDDHDHDHGSAYHD